MSKRRRRFTEKAFSILLSIVFILSSVPAFAADSGPVSGLSQEDEDAFAAIGIDTSVVPEGVDLSSNDNPYGKDRVDVIPVYELFEGKVEVDTAPDAANRAAQTARIFGDGAAMLATKAKFYDDQARNATSTTAVTPGGYSAFAAVSGNFTGSGLKDKIVTVAAGTWDPTPDPDGVPAEGQPQLYKPLTNAQKGANAGLYMYVTDPESGDTSTVKTILNTTKVIGNLGRYSQENFNDAPYQLQNYLQVAAGDFDGNGIDEIAVYIPDGANGTTSSNSRVEVYRLKYTDSSLPIDNYLNTANWELAWTYPFQEGTYVSNMVSLLAGDFNRDGTDDLAMSWGVYYSSAYKTNSQAKILYGSKTSNMLAVAKPFDLKYGTSQLVRAAFAYADINGDNVDEVVLGAQSEDDINAGLMNTRVINVYAYNGTLDAFMKLSSDNFSLVSFENDDGVTQQLTDGKYYSSPAMVANITPIRLEGRTKNYMIYLDSVLYAYGENGLEIYDMMEDAADGGSAMLLDATRLLDFPERKVQQVEMSKYYVEYGASNADFTGDSLESLHMNQYFLLQEVRSSWDGNWYELFSHLWFFRGLRDWDPQYFTQAGVYHKEEGLFKAHAFYVTMNNANTIEVFNHKLLHSAIGKLDRYYALLNMDNDTSFMSYKNKHYIRYTDPEVLAVMASAPYFADVAQMEGGDNHVGNSSTSFTASDGTGTGTSKSDTLSIGAYFGIDQDITVLGVKVASFEMELEYKHGWTWETEKNSMMTQSITYTSIAGQDSVAFYSIPMEIYEYELNTPIVDANDIVIGYNTQIIALNIPHNASKTVLSLDRYEAIAADYPELPQISGTVLKHTIGSPSTYPKSSAGYRDPIEFNSVALVGYGDGSLTQEIEMSNETEKVYTNTNAVDFKIGGGAGSFKAGITVGYEGSRGKITVTTAGSTYAATIVNMPEEASDYQYSYTWKLFTYNYSDGLNGFPVVNFIVENVVEPPKLPQDFDWDSETAGSTEVDLTWSYKGNVSSFVLYRQYDFSGEKKLVQIATVPASEIIGLAPDGLTKLYRYHVTGLSPYQDYGFSIQVERQLIPVRSAKSALIFTRTKTDSGFPDITLSSNELKVYPDTTGTVSVNVSYDGQPGDTVYKAIIYQWQKKIDDVWTNLSQLSNYTTKTLMLANSGISTAGEYRCRVDVIYYDAIRGDEYLITGYSSSVDVDYSKRNSTISSIETDETSLASPGLKVIVNNPSGDSVKVPIGIVKFVIKGMDYEKTYYKALEKVLNTKSSKAEILKNTISELPEGIYEITAYYSGDRYFRSSTSATMMYKSGTGTGYWLELSSEALYGNILTPVLNEVTGQGSTSVKEAVDTDYTYEVAKEVTDATLGVTWVNQIGWVTGNSITAKQAGNYKVNAIINDVVVASKNLVVKPYPLTLKAKNIERVVNTDAVMHPTLDDLTMYKSGSDQALTSLPNGDTLSGLGLYMRVENTAYEEGTIIKHDPELGTDPDPDGDPTTIDPIPYGEHWFYKPGNYTVVADVLDDPLDAVDEARALALANYQITYVDANYRMISGAYDVVAIPRLLNGQDRGTIEVREPFEYVLGNQYQSGTQLKFEAVPFNGYEVKAWYVGNSPATLAAAEPYKVADQLFTDDFLNITMRSEAVYVGVEFRIAQLTLTYKPNDPLFGKVENLDSPHLVSGAVFLKGTEYDFKATANPGYHFTDWAVTGAASYVATDDTLKVIGGDKDVIVQANFKRDTYPIHLIGDLQAVYYANLDGDNSTPDEKVIALDGALIPGDTEVTVVPKSGFQIIKWIGMTNETQAYVFEMLEETTIEAETAYRGFEVTLNTIQAALPGSEVVSSENLDNFIVGGSAVTFEAKPAYGTVFKGFKINGSTDYYVNPLAPQPDEPLLLSPNGRTLTIVAIGADYQIEAVFENNAARTLTLNKAVHGSMTGSVSNTMYGTVNNPIFSFGTEEVSTTITVYDGDELTFSTIPDPGFQVIYWKEDKNLIQSAQTDYAPLVISADKALTVDFGAVGYYTVTYSSADETFGKIGSATVEGQPFTSPNDSIGAGTLLAFTAVPEPGYMVEKWTINGVEVMNDYGKRLVDDALIFVIGETSDVIVSFVEIVTHDISYGGDNYSGKVIEVDPVEFAQGDTSTGYTQVKDGAYAKFQLVPAAGYYIENIAVTMNGVPSAFDKLTKDTYVYGSSTGETWTGEIYAVTDDVTVEVVTNPIYTLALSLSQSATTFEVTNIKPYNASNTLPLIENDVTYFVRDGAHVKMIITPDTGYKIKDVVVTGTTQFTLTQGSNNQPWGLELTSMDGNTTVTVTTEGNKPPNPPNPPNPEPGPGPGPVGPIVIIEDDEIPLGISRLEGATLYEIEFVKKGLISVGALTMEEFELIVEEVIGQESERIIFANKDPITTDKLTLTMPKAGLKKFLDETDTQLEITLEIANVTITRATLTKILEEATGDEVKLTMALVNTNLYSKDKKTLVGRRPVVNVSLTSYTLTPAGTIDTTGTVNITSLAPIKWSVELPYEPKKGEDPEKIEVYYFDTDGTLKRIIGTTYDEQLGFVSFDTSVLGDYVIKHDWISPFKDLDPKAWYYDYIFSAFANGLMKGVATDRFDPSSNATRGMIATMLFQLDGSVEVEHASTFNDIPGNAWFAKGVAWAVHNKIFAGYSNNAFKPNDPITREQLAVVIYNYLVSKDLAPATTGNLNAFPDQAKVSPYAVEAITWMVQNGFMSGKGDGTLDPQGFATRAEVAAMFDKLIQ